MRNAHCTPGHIVVVNNTRVSSVYDPSIVRVNQFYASTSGADDACLFSQSSLVAMSALAVRSTLGSN